MVIFKKDSYPYGILIGLIMPMLSFFGFYYWKFRFFTLDDFLFALRTNKQLVTAISIPCLLLNIVLFTVFINGIKDKTAKGIFIVTLIYAVAALIFKFVG
ncbi:MAG: hypothetical protein ACK5AO_09620 [bacterium]|jgi:hypothetical protein